MLGPIRKAAQSKPEDWPSYGHADAFPTYSSQACSVTQVVSVNLKRKGFERKTTQWAWSWVYWACPVRQEFHHSHTSALCTGPTKPTASCSGFNTPVFQSWNSVGNRGLQQERLLGLLSNMVILQAFSWHPGMWVLLLREFASNFSPLSVSHSAPHIPVHKRLPQKGQKRAYLRALPSWF